MLMSDGALAPTSLADSTPQFSTFYYPNTGVPLAGGFATYAALYKTQVWVATLVNKVAYAAARLPLKVYERGTNGRSDARDSPYAQLLRNPNGRHDPFFFWLWTVSTFEVYGEALWVKVRPEPGAPPTSLLPMHPANVWNQFNRDTGRFEYHFGSGNSNTPIMRFDEADVVHFRSYNPENQQRGLSRLEPLRLSLVTEDAIRRAQGAWYKNTGQPGVLLQHPSKLSLEAATRLTTSWDSIHGGPENFGKTAVLEEGMTATTLAIDAQQLELIASLKLTANEACAIYDVPPPVVHILDHATFSNITEQMRSQYRDTMAPRLGLFESVLDVQLRPEFDTDGVLYAEFLLDQVLRGDFEARVSAYETMFRIAGFTPGEIRQLENLPDLGEDTHRLYVNAATIPLGTAAGGNPPGQEVEVKPQAIKSATVRALMGRIGTADVLADVNPALLVTGLNGETPLVLDAYRKSLAAGERVDDFRRRLKAMAQED